MRLRKIVFMVSVVLLAAASSVAAGDFDWISDFNIRAGADPSGFRMSLGARFNIGDAQVSAVLSNVERPADAYMIFRLGEMSGKPADYVMKQYRSGKGKGWGELAKSLGIKPGSPEFHALKRGSDLYDNKGKDKSKGKEKNKDKGKGKGRGKN